GQRDRGTFRDEPAGGVATSPRLARCRPRDRAEARKGAPLPFRSRTTRSGTGVDRTLRAVLGRPAAASSEASREKDQGMSKTVRREILIPQPREQVWRALTDSTSLAEWMFPNDFAPEVGHHFTFRVPPNPKVGFDGMVVTCEVLECEPPDRLAFSWSA